MKWFGKIADNYPTETFGQHRFVYGDCIEVLKCFPESVVDVVVTSPPYNIGIDYNTYNDRRDSSEYLKWIYDWGTAISKVLKPDGSFFLNVAGSVSKPWVPFDILNCLRWSFKLQNQIVWVKSIHISDGHSFGHFKPINSKRFLNNTHEFIFHLTLDAKVPLDKLSIGVPYVDKSNSTRWKSQQNKRCRGNTWYIPYKTKQTKDRHPAMFPVELPEWCIRLHGVRPDLLVLDPFAGLGTTLRAARRLSVNSIGIEIDEGYWRESIIRRQADDKMD